MSFVVINACSNPLCRKNPICPSCNDVVEPAVFGISAESQLRTSNRIQFRNVLLGNTCKYLFCLPGFIIFFRMYCLRYSLVITPSTASNLA